MANDTLTEQQEHVRRLEIIFKQGEIIILLTNPDRKWKEWNNSPPPPAKEIQISRLIRNYKEETKHWSDPFLTRWSELQECYMHDGRAVDCGRQSALRWRFSKRCYCLKVLNWHICLAIPISVFVVFVLVEMFS